MRDVSSAIHFYLPYNKSGENQLLQFSLVDAVSAMERRAGQNLTQEEVNALNIFLNIHEQNQIDYYHQVIYPWIQFGHNKTAPQ